MDQQKHTLHVKGMHCASCVLLIRDTVNEVTGISDVEVSLQQETISIVCDRADMSPETLSAMLNPLVASYGYTFHTTPAKKTIRWSEYLLAVVIAVVLIYGFVQLQKLGLLQFIDGEQRTYSTSFFIGLIASISSCLAVVGAVVLALGTVYAQSNSFRPQSLFHLGRLVSFFVLGGVLGAIGSTFQLSQTTSIVLNMIISVVLFVLGLNLLGVIRGGVTRSGGVFARFTRAGSAIWGPLLIGVGTFFLPCGFTQSMQIYTLSTGSFLAGGLTMLSFALGTLPMLLILSVTGKTIQKSSSSGLFFKTIGVILVIISLYNFVSSLVALGFIAPFFSL